MPTTRSFCVLLLLLALASPQNAAAQDLASPPSVRQLVPAEVPEGTVFPGPAVEVVLELDVDATGSVTDARVATGAGEPFDSAAVAAGRRMLFEPGRLETGEGVPVTVTFRLRIEAPPPPPPPPVEVPEPVAVERPAPVAAPDPVDDDARDEIAPEYETVVRTETPRNEVTRQIVTADVVARVAGTQGDTLKAVQNLPGVARASFGAGTLILRGASPGDSRVFLEGQEIPLLYHFGGLRSTFNSAFLEAVELYPGNFAPDYGRALGGIVEVRARPPAADRLRGQVDLNLYDAGFAAEGPLGGDWSIGGAFHRSYIDTILSAVLPSDAAVSFDTAPRYYDFQLLAAHRPSPRRELRLTFYGARDSVALLFDEPQNDPTVRGAITAAVSFYTLQAAYRSPLGAGLRQETTVSLGLQNIETDIGPEYFFDLGVRRASLRSTVAASPLRWLGVRAGLDVQLSEAGIALQVPDTGGGEGNPSAPAAVSPAIAADTSAVILAPAAFVEARLRPIAPLLILPSLRADYTGPIERISFDPRLAVRYEIAEATTLTGGIGVFQQAPAPDESNDLTGNPDLLPERSLHASLGVEQEWGPFEVQLTGFAKSLDRLVVPNVARVYDPAAPRFTNDGEGRIFGAELLVKAQFGRRAQGWIAYTFQRSLRRDAPDVEERSFDFDQPHILTMVGSAELGAGFSASLRFRLVSGNPTTPVVGANYDAGTDVFVPIYGAVNSDRLGTFHQLDARLDRVWQFRHWKFAAYLDVQNVYNRANAEGTRYSYDYSRRANVTGLPILPILGVRADW